MDLSWAIRITEFAICTVIGVFCWRYIQDRFSFLQDDLTGSVKSIMSAIEKLGKAMEDLWHNAHYANDIIDTNKNDIQAIKESIEGIQNVKIAALEEDIQKLFNAIQDMKPKKAKTSKDTDDNN